MPSPRKRIGFLPSSEVQKIIDNICENNNLSQSKVTGILVEEALCSRGVLKSTSAKYPIKFDSYNNKKTKFDNNNLLKKNTQFNYHDSNLDECFMRDEVQMINDYIKFKFFKNVMNKNEENMQ